MEKYTIEENGKTYEITQGVELITPGKAKEYLDLNFEENRRESAESISAYGRDMTARMWVFTGDPIKFDTNGRLVDGQHRLEAIIASGVPKQINVVRGLIPDAVMCIDKGKKRSFADTMRITQNDTILRVSSTPSAIRRLFKHEVNHQRILTETEIIWLYGCFETECLALNRIIPHGLGKPFTADFRGACLGALIAGVSQADLAEYVKVIRTRMPSMKYNDEAALKWEDTIHKATGRTMEGSQMFYGTQNSIYYFLRTAKYQRHRETKKWFPVKDKIIAAIQCREGTL